MLFGPMWLNFFRALTALTQMPKSQKLSIAAPRAPFSNGLTNSPFQYAFEGHAAKDC